MVVAYAFGTRTGLGDLDGAKSPRRRREWGRWWDDRRGSATIRRPMRCRIPLRLNTTFIARTDRPVFDSTQWLAVRGAVRARGVGPRLREEVGACAILGRERGRGGSMEEVVVQAVGGGVRRRKWLFASAWVGRADGGRPRTPPGSAGRRQARARIGRIARRDRAIVGVPGAFGDGRAAARNRWRRAVRDMVRCARGAGRRPVRVLVV